MLLFSRQGKLRLSKYYSTFSQKERSKVVRDVMASVLNRPSKLSNFVDWRSGTKLVYRRYASLFFCVCVDEGDNELLALEAIHHYVEILDRYFGNVCELDLIFSFHKAYHILDEVILAGEVHETSKKAVSRAVQEQDALVESAAIPEDEL